MPKATKPPGKKPASKRSHLEAGFIFTFKQLRGSAALPEREFAFAKSILSDKGKPRMWRFDFAWPDAKLAVEIDGGIFMGGKGGGHNRGVQFSGDCDKLNAAVTLGWRVLRFTTIHIERQPVQCVELVLGELWKSPPVTYQREIFEV